MLSFNDLPTVTGMRFGEINQAIACEGFPRPAVISGRAVWWASEVQEWLTNQFSGKDIKWLRGDHDARSVKLLREKRHPLKPSASARRVQNAWPLKKPKRTRRRCPVRRGRKAIRGRKVRRVSPVRRDRRGSPESPERWASMATMAAMAKTAPNFWKGRAIQEKQTARIPTFG